MNNPCNEIGPFTLHFYGKGAVQKRTAGEPSLVNGGVVKRGFEPLRCPSAAMTTHFSQLNHPLCNPPPPPMAVRRRFSKYGDSSVWDRTCATGNCLISTFPQKKKSSFGCSLSVHPSATMEVSEKNICLR